MSIVCNARSSSVLFASKLQILRYLCIYIELHKLQMAHAIHRFFITRYTNSSIQEQNSSRCLSLLDPSDPLINPFCRTNRTIIPNNLKTHTCEYTFQSFFQSIFDGFVRVPSQRHLACGSILFYFCDSACEF